MLVKSVQQSFGSFVRGQLFCALAYALLTAAVMLAFGLPDVALSSLAAGLFVILPLIGNYLAYLPPLLTCLVARPEQALILFVVLVIVQGIYMNFISPRIMAGAVNMHPLVTIASILIFGQVGGFWGAFFGIPIASTIGMLARPTMQLIHDYLSPSADEETQTTARLPMEPTGTRVTATESPVPAMAPAPAIYPEGRANKDSPGSTLSTAATSVTVTPHSAD